MLNFKDKLKRAISYKEANFFDAKSIGVVARGPSNIHLNICSDYFNHCFLAGEFNRTLDIIGHYLLGKSVVLSILQSKRYRTSKENCKKYNIKNMQVFYPDDSEELEEIRRKNSDLKVVGYNRYHYELSEKIFTFKNKGIYSTGIAGVFNAIYFKPEKIYIIGMDFYNEEDPKYEVVEKHDILYKNAVEDSRDHMREGMIENLYSMCHVCPEIEFNIYTTFRGLDHGIKNLKIYYVS